MAYNWVFILELILGIISILGSLLTVLSFILFHEIRSFSLELVCYLSISTLMSTLGYIIYSNDDPSDLNLGLCKTQSFLITSFETSQFIWCTLICYSIYTNIMNFNESHELDNKNSKIKRRVIFNLLGFGIPLTFSSILLGTNKLGPANDRWCWINKIAKSKDYLASDIIVLIYMMFLWACFLYSMISIIRVICFLKSNFLSEMEKSFVVKYINKLKFYPIIQAISLIPLTISRLLHFFDLLVNSDILSLLITLTVVTQGLMFTIIFGLNPQIREEWMFILRCCKVKQVDENNANASFELPTIAKQSSFEEI